ncbi:MAG TPA: MFS transporter [Streptosporangiaceae bacterium]
MTSAAGSGVVAPRGDAAVTPARRGALVFLGLATTLAIIDATIVNVALPSISRSLGLSLTAGEWVVSGYGVTLASLLISSGRLADRLGQRRTLLAGVVLFAAASLACALAPNGAALVSARLVQGAGAAAILPSVLSVINSTFRGEARAAAFAVYGVTIAVAAALGPLAGSALVDAFGWQAAFIVNLPLAVVVIAGTMSTIPPIPGRRSEGADPAGQVLLLAGLVLLVFGLVEAPRAGWLTATRPLVLGPVRWAGDGRVSLAFLALLGCVLALLAFLATERARARRDRPTLVDLTLLRIPSFRAGLLALLVVALGEFGLLFLLPLYLQVGRGLSPLGAQVVLLPVALGSFVSAPVTIRRPRTPARTWVLLGLGLEVTGLLLVALVLTPGVPYWLISLPLMIYGAGVGFAISQLTSATLLAVPFARLGQASGLSSTARQVGSAIGVAVLTAIVSGVLVLTLPHQLARQVPKLGAGQRTAIAAAISGSPADPASGGRAFASLPPPARPGAARATTTSLAAGTRLAALGAALPIGLAWLLARRLPAGSG